MSTLAYPPISHPYRILDGFDVHRSEKLIIAFVAVDTPQGPKIRMYRWQKRNDSWKIDLCRMSVEWWDWSAIPSKISKFVKNISKIQTNPIQITTQKVHLQTTSEVLFQLKLIFR